MTRGKDWTDAENALTIADYFAMLGKELSGERLNKTAHRKGLLEHIDRSETAIEYKHRNISAILQSLGETWIDGYKPAFNFQMPLADAVVEWLRANPGISEKLSLNEQVTGLQDVAQLFVGPAPTMRNEPPPKELEKALRIARKFDIAGRDERNRKLGRAGEELVFNRERSLLTASGRSDLSKRVIWTSEEEGDGAGYDIASFNPDGSPRLIEVKTTNGWDRTPFHISRNELQTANDRRAEWSLFRLWNFRREPKAFELFPPLESHVQLTPTSFQASFQ